MLHFSSAAFRCVAFFIILLQLQSCGYKAMVPLSEVIEPPVANAGKPNFVIILIDDLGWADIGINGSTFYQTPNIDRLASTGIQFRQAYAAAPVCSPTRAALLTGKHPARLHITDWLPGRADQPTHKLLRAQLKAALPLDATTLPEVLKRAGYKSAHIGKWHLGDSAFGPLQQGFDINIGGDHSGTPASYFFPYANETHNRWRIPGLTGGKEKEYLTDRLTSEAERFIAENKNQPFLLYLAHFAVHIPMKAKEELINKYKNLSNPAAAQHNAIYAAMIQSVDESLGSIVNKLTELHLDQNTVVIFTSDNGGLSVEEGPNTPATSNAPLKEGKGHLYEGGIRVPLVIHLPGKRSGLASDVPVTTMDLFPTILEMAGIKWKDTTDGKSLLPLLSGQAQPQRNLYWHYPHYSNQGGKPGWAIRQGDYKLIQFFEDGNVELYNIKNDPGEEKNIAPQHPQQVALLKQALEQWGKRAGAQFMRPNPNFKSI